MLLSMKNAQSDAVKRLKGRLPELANERNAACNIATSIVPTDWIHSWMSFLAIRGHRNEISHRAG